MPVISRLRALVVFPVLLAAMVSATLALAPAAEASSHRHKIVHARNVALHQIGDRYQYGAAGPNRFDCSGLIYFSYHRAGLKNVPRTSSAQARHARHIKKRNLRPGDFMFFRNSGGIYHVGIFLKWRHGHAVMLHSPSSGKRVQRAKPWTSHWFAGTLR